MKKLTIPMVSFVSDYRSAEVYNRSIHCIVWTAWSAFRWAADARRFHIGSMYSGWYAASRPAPAGWGHCPHVNHAAAYIHPHFHLIKSYDISAWDAINISIWDNTCDTHRTEQLVIWCSCINRFWYWYTCVCAWTLMQYQSRWSCFCQGDLERCWEQIAI